MDADQNEACPVEINPVSASLHYGQNAQAPVGHLDCLTTPNSSNGNTRHRVLLPIVARHLASATAVPPGWLTAIALNHWGCTSNTRQVGGHSS